MPIARARAGLRRLVTRDDRALQGRARARADPGDRAAHARTRHRGGLRPARRVGRADGASRPASAASSSGPAIPEALVAWYAEHVGVPVQPDGYVVFTDSRDAHVWSPFAAGHRLLAGGEAGDGELHRPQTSTRCSRSCATPGSRRTSRSRSSTGSAASAGRSTRRATASSSGSRRRPRRSGLSRRRLRHDLDESARAARGARGSLLRRTTASRACRWNACASASVSKSSSTIT